jgi:hypothetical protein
VVSPRAVRWLTSEYYPAYKIANPLDTRKLVHFIDMPVLRELVSHQEQLQSAVSDTLAVNTIFNCSDEQIKHFMRDKLRQTYFADNPLLHYIENWDYESFINDELKNRKDTFMPPFSRLIMIKGSCLSEHVLHSFMHHIAQKAPIDKQVEVLGPSPAPMYKIRNKFRYRIILRTSKQVNIQDYIHNWFNQFVTPASIKLKVDVDPYNFS